MALNTRIACTNLALCSRFTGFYAHVHSCISCIALVYGYNIAADLQSLRRICHSAKANVTEGRDKEGGGVGEIKKENTINN